MKTIWVILLLSLSVPVQGQARNAVSQSDTLGADSSPVETVVVSASQVTIDEVIEAITRRIEREDALMFEYEYTTLVTVVIRDEPVGDDGDYQIEENASRYHYSRSMGTQVAQLWERSRKFEDGEQVEDEVDEELSAEFLPLQENMTETMPFSPNGGRSYDYSILDRQLVGNNLIYKVGFEPKDKFEALPSGTVWVDYSNWVVRKFESRMIETVPYPIFIESIPVYRLSQERFGDFWFPTEMQMQIQLRKIPLLGIPDNVEVRVSLQDIIINGKTINPEDTVPGAGDSDITEEEIAEGFWLSAEANNDSLATYWGQIKRVWEQDLSPETIPITLAPAKIDSLTGAGSAALLELREGNLWRVEPQLMLAPGYNRAQGLVARLGMSLEKVGPHNPRLDLTAGYAFSNQRPVFSGDLRIPILRAHWGLKEAPLDGRKYLGPEYEALSLHLAGEKSAGLFAGDGRRHTRSFSSFFYGGDPNQYFEQRGLAGYLKWRLSRGLRLQAGGGYFEHRSWAQRTNWNLFGQSLDPEGNLAADSLNEGFVAVEAAWRRGPLKIEGGITWHDLRDTPALGGEATLREIKVSGELASLDPLGNRWVFRGAHRGFDGQAPVQWKSWLGDYGSLRGYNAGELTGDSGTRFSLDTRLGFDLFRVARIPILKKWGLQPLGFVDWGKTWNSSTESLGPESPGMGDTGWRMDVGFGFGRRFDLPGLGEFKNIRLYAGHPVGEGSAGHGWRVLLGFEK